MLKLNEHAVEVLPKPARERSGTLEARPVPLKSSEQSGEGARADVNGRPSRWRVLHVLNRLDTGGTEHAVMNVVGGLDAEEFDHHFCVTRGFNPENEMVRRLERGPYVAGERDAGSQFLVPRLLRIIRECRPHIVHSRNWGAIEAMPAAWIARVPVAIHSEHGYELDMMKGLPVRQRMFRRMAYSMADVVFTVTEELREFHAVQASISPARIRVVRNGVDTARFAPCEESRAAARQRLGITSGSFVVGSVGRMVSIKDYPTLLKAAALVASRGVDVVVVLAGSGPELDVLRKQAGDITALAGRVHFVGAATNVPELLNAMDVFVLTSVLEGMSNTILEAMACGRPVVATRVGGNPELVAEGVCGCLFAPGDAADLAKRLEQLAKLPRERCKFGGEARKLAESRFSLHEMIRNYRELYLGLAERRVTGTRDN